MDARDIFIIGFSPTSFYYTMEGDTSNHVYEIDFLTSVGNKICPIEVKAGNYGSHKSLDMFWNKFGSRIGERYVAVSITDFEMLMQFNRAKSNERIIKKEEQYITTKFSSCRCIYKNFNKSFFNGEKNNFI